jgi:hypothetical protein
MVDDRERRLGRRGVMRSLLGAGTLAAAAARGATAFDRGSADWRPALALVSTVGPVEARLQAGHIGRGRGATSGAASGTLRGLEGAVDILSDTGGGTGPAGGVAAVVALAAAGLVFLGQAVAGTVAGTMAALPQAEAERIEAVIERTLVRPGLGDRLRAAALAYAAEQFGPAVHDAGPAPETGGPERAALADLAAQGVGTVLLLDLDGLGFIAASPGRDPDLVLAARGGYRRIATADGTAAPVQAGLLATAGPHKLSAWTAADGVLIEQTVPMLLAELARRLVDHALLEVRWEYPG